ncbi:hypothetical protein VULLAG_LOCUS11324 [Vulpes lagopus]
MQYRVNSPSVPGLFQGVWTPRPGAAGEVVLDGSSGHAGAPAPRSSFSAACGGRRPPAWGPDRVAHTPSRAPSPGQPAGQGNQQAWLVAAPEPSRGARTRRDAGTPARPRRQVPPARSLNARWTRAVPSIAPSGRELAKVTNQRVRHISRPGSQQPIAASVRSRARPGDRRPALRRRRRESLLRRPRARVALALLRGAGPGWRPLAPGGEGGLPGRAEWPPPGAVGEAAERRMLGRRRRGSSLIPDVDLLSAVESPWPEYFLKIILSRLSV